MRPRQVCSAIYLRLRDKALKIALKTVSKKMSKKIKKVLTKLGCGDKINLADAVKIRTKRQRNIKNEP